MSEFSLWQSYLPPSFPSYLETSTPKDAAQPVKPNSHEKHKPAPILPRPFFASSPPSPPLSNLSPFNPARPSRKPHQPLGMSSSLPIISPTAHILANKESRALKRTRPLTPPDDDVFSSGIPKKQRIEMAQDTPRQGTSAPPPPSSPPPVITPPLSKSTSSPHPAPLVMVGNGLGNANGLPILETPDRNQLPHLTDLLASSRKSKPRPRPPSKKLNVPTDANAQTDQSHGENYEGHVLPVLEDAQPVREVSPAKTFFSSPASGSSQSTPQSLRRRPRSPISPLFGVGAASDISRFDPPFTSTQHRQPESLAQPTRSIFKSGFGGAGAGPGLQQGQFGLARASSGFFGMYSSQFDVEAQVGQVADFLERERQKPSLRQKASKSI